MNKKVKQEIMNELCSLNRRINDLQGTIDDYCRNSSIYPIYEGIEPRLDQLERKLEILIVKVKGLSCE